MLGREWPAVTAMLNIEERYAERLERPRSAEKTVGRAGALLPSCRRQVCLLRAGEPIGLVFDEDDVRDTQPTTKSSVG
jgi:hypothetical protein